MKSVSAAVIIAALAISAVTSRGHDARAQRPEGKGDNKVQDPKDKASAWMKYKLAASQKILEGMTRADYAMIEKHAAAMQNVGYLEEWGRADVPGYASHLHAFKHANRDLVLAAQAKNLDGVTIAYSQLTISCMQCHRFIRDRVKE